jgi:hypothetical protein
VSPQADVATRLKLAVDNAKALAHSDAILDAAHELYYSDPNCPCDTACDPCADCAHPDCAHHEGRGCRVTGCTCFRMLSDTDCLACKGTGDVSIDVEQPSGRVVEDDRPCPDCRGTGVAS